MFTDITTVQNDLLYLKSINEITKYSMFTNIFYVKLI